MIYSQNVNMVCINNQEFRRSIMTKISLLQRSSFIISIKYIRSCILPISLKFVYWIVSKIFWFYYSLLHPYITFWRIFVFVSINSQIILETKILRARKLLENYRQHLILARNRLHSVGLHCFYCLKSNVVVSYMGAKIFGYFENSEGIRIDL